MMKLGPGEIILIVAVALVVFGPSRLPELGRAIGKGIGELRQASNDLKKNLEINEDMEETKKDV